MNTVLLTTETLHHCHFLREIAKRHAPALVVNETTGVKPGFKTRHPFEDKREDYELGELFDHSRPKLADYAPVLNSPSVNSGDVVATLEDIAPDVIIDFGTGRVAEPLIAACPDGIINLHGGDPERYRGLDSHLWAVYHNDFGALVTTLHRLNRRLDDGDIISRVKIPLAKDLPLHALRRHNTDVCIQMVLSALDMFHRHGRFLSSPQRQAGRYYSFMPAPLKAVCLEKFESYTGHLC